jgi:hypothetical protein
MSICGLFGLIRSFAPSYEWFLVFEFLDAAFGSGSYICGFVMGMFSTYRKKIRLMFYDRNDRGRIGWPKKESSNWYLN